MVNHRAIEIVSPTCPKRGCGCDVIVKVPMKLKIIPAYLKGLPKQRRMAFSPPEYPSSF